MATPRSSITIKRFKQWFNITRLFTKSNIRFVWFEYQLFERTKKCTPLAKRASSRMDQRTSNAINFTDDSLTNFNKKLYDTCFCMQVCQWLLALGLEQHTPKFLEHGVEGGALLQLDSRDLKILGVAGDDKTKFKRKLKELKHIVEKEKRQQEKDRKEREKMIRKAEKKAEKTASKKK